MSALSGRVALVTGGGRGIGAATATLLASRGAKVAVNYVGRQSRAEDMVRAITSAGGTALAVGADVRDAQQVERMVGEVADRWGSLDILVNNANMAFVMKPISDMIWDEFSQKLNDEMRAAFYVTKAVTPWMEKNRYGRIVYVASGLAKRPGLRMAAHGTAKAALAQFARYVALEYGPKGITANVISPGLVMTEATAFAPEEQLQRTAAMTPLGRLAEPEDVANAIAMCVGDDSRFVTGAYIPVNGGVAME